MMNVRVLASVLLSATGLVMAAEFPRPLPAITISEAGKPLDLKQFKGKILVVEFLSTVCPACQDCARVLTKIQADYAAKGVQVVGVAMNPGAATLTEGFKQRLGTNFPVGSTAEDEARAFLQVSVMNPFMVPHLAFIDRNGVIRSQEGGEDRRFYTMKDQIIRSTLDKMLAAAPAGAAVPKKK